MIEEEAGKSNVKKYLVFLVIVIIVLIFAIFYLFNGIEDENEILMCGDGTLYNECSLRRPYFCMNRTLVERASICGCSELLEQKGNVCISKYQINSKEITLDYILRGEQNHISFTVYQGIVNYILNLSRTISYSSDETPSRADFKLRNINEPEQRELLLPLVTKIQNIAPASKEDQARIAISLVQKISFGNSNKTVNFIGDYQLNYSRYPYEVLYDIEGICGEKSELLSFLLKEIGYEIVFFYHKPENHESLGIKCPEKYSMDNSGYCFIETTGPSIITDSQITYVGGITLFSQPEILFISEGDSLPDDLYEYNDAEDWIKIRDNIKEKGGVSFFDTDDYNELVENYGLVGEYNV